MPGVDKISDHLIVVKIMLKSNVKRSECKPYKNKKDLKYF